MKKLVWVAGAILIFSLVFPNGINVRPPVKPTPTPVDPAVPAATPDAKIVELLSSASAADRGRIISVYTGLRTVMLRDKGKRINTTEKLAELQANTLQLAIDKPGTYPGLDVAIDAVFAAQIGTDDVLAITDEVTQRVVKACDIIIASAK